MPATLTQDQQFYLFPRNDPNWHVGIQDAMAKAERGIHMTGIAGMDIKTGHAIEMSSQGSGYFKHANANSAAGANGYYWPVGVSYYSVSSGQSINILVYGVLRSLDILSNAYSRIGFPVMVSPSTPGVIVTSIAGGPIIGISVPNGILIMPNAIQEIT